MTTQKTEHSDASIQAHTIMVTRVIERTILLNSADSKHFSEQLLHHVLSRPPVKPELLDLYISILEERTVCDVEAGLELVSQRIDAAINAVKDAVG